MKQKLNKIYELALENNLISTKILTENKFYYSDIQILIARNIIKKSKRGYYELVDYSEFYNEALNNIKAGYYDEAKKYFIACFNHNIEIASVSYYLMGLSIIDHDISNAFKYFTYYYDNNELNPNCNLYLYLFYHFYKLPDNYLLCASNLKLNDILIPNPSNDPEIDSQNDIRRNIYNGKLNITFDNENFENIIYKNFFDIISNFKRNSHVEILDLISNQKYEELHTYLETYLKYHKNNQTLIYCFKLTNVLLDMQKNHKLPICKTNDLISVKDALDAIDIENYDLALNKQLERINKFNYDTNNDYIYLLLKAIQNEKNNIEKCNAQKINDLLLEKIINDLKNNQLSNILNDIRTYLKNADLANYEFLIIDLLKISLLSKDLSFNNIIDTLNRLHDKTYSYDLKSYILDFYEFLSKEEYNIARQYLDIISNSKKFDIEWNLTSQMTKVLLMSENVLSYQENMQKLKELEERLNLIKIEDKPEVTEKPEAPTTSKETTTFIIPKLKASNNLGINAYYQKIPSLNAIVSYFLNGADVNTVSKSTKVSRELILISALLIAKEYFLMGNSYLGEKYLNTVLKAKHKSSNVCNLLYEITQNKDKIDETYTSPITPLLKK